MTVKMDFKKYVEDFCVYSTGEVVFIDGETKSADFDTLDDPINLSIFRSGELRMKLEEKSGSPVLRVGFGSIDHKTGDFYEQINSGNLTENGVGRISASFLGSRTAIKATLSGGSFKITITGEFKK